MARGAADLLRQRPLGRPHPLTQNGRYFYTIAAWRDLFETWRSDFLKKQEAGQKLSLELIEGRELVERSAKKASGADREVMETTLERLSRDRADEALATRLLLSNDLHIAMRRSGERTNLSHYKTVLECFVDRTAARYRRVVRSLPALDERRCRTATAPLTM